MSSLTATTTKIEGTGFEQVYTMRYHNTDVVVVDYKNGTVTLDNGGWQTVTTKSRMNLAMQNLGLPFQIYQKKYQWFVENYERDSIVAEFESDSVTFNL